VKSLQGEHLSLEAVDLAHEVEAGYRAEEVANMAES